MDNAPTNSLVIAIILLLSAGLGPANAAGNEPAIQIQAFSISGAKVFEEKKLTDLLSPYLGPERRFADIQQALQTLQTYYQQQGYGEALVTVPTQTLSDGIVRFTIIEPRLSRLSFDYQPQFLKEYYPEPEISAILPALKIGEFINSRAIAANLQLANENPARKLEVQLNQESTPGVFNGQIKIKGLPPRKLFATLDNTGAQQTGEYRMGYGIQHANLWGEGHVASFNYITPIDFPGRINLYSGNYRIPLPRWGDSVELLAAKSDIGATNTTTTLGDLQFAGSGEIYAASYNLILPRHGEYSQRLILGWNYKQYANNCAANQNNSQICGTVNHNIGITPFSLGYGGQLSQTSQALSFQLAGYHNFTGLSSNSGQASFNLLRPGSGVNGAPAEYTLFKGNYNYTLNLDHDWQFRLAGHGQYSANPLIYVEQFGLVGSSLVRGFWEREVVRDIGFSLNQEIQTPNLAPYTGLTDMFRGFIFYDYGEGRNNLLPGEVNNFVKLSSAGFGLRLGSPQSWQLKFDGAYVLNGAASHPTGDVRGHLSFQLPYSF